MAQPDPNLSAQNLEAKSQRTRWLLFGLLIIVSTVPLLPPFANKITIPDRPDKDAMDFYALTQSVPEGSTVLVETDWTNSTRGESGGQFEAVMRILMRRHVKTAFYSMDPQGPKVADDEMDYLNSIRGKDEPAYKQWTDYVSLGYFANPEATINGLVADLRTVFAGKKDVDPQGKYEDVFQSPVLANIHRLSDIPLVIIVTPSSTFTAIVQRFSGKVHAMEASVTGVMGPESLNYYVTGQMKGLIVGLKGAFDLETCMNYGLNEPPDKPEVSDPGQPTVPKLPGQDFGRGNLYIATLHAGLFLLIIAVITGNVGMLRARKAGKK